MSSKPNPKYLASGKPNSRKKALPTKPNNQIAALATKEASTQASKTE